MFCRSHFYLVDLRHFDNSLMVNPDLFKLELKIFSILVDCYVSNVPKLNWSILWLMLMSLKYQSCQSLKSKPQKVDFIQYLLGARRIKAEQEVLAR